MRIAVLGLGEAGSIYAADLAQRGATVVAADPVILDPPAGVSRAADVPEAVRGADVVLSLVGARAASAVLELAIPELGDRALYADMNTGGPDDKRALAALADAAGVPFVDVAILAPVPRDRSGTPLLASGSGASLLVPRLELLGIPVTDVGTDAGSAASLKLLRSVFMKGLAGLVFESVTAADGIGARDWVTDQIASELGPDGAALVDRLITGTTKHAVRRESEMRESLAFLESLGSPAWMTRGTVRWLQEISGRRKR